MADSMIGIALLSEEATALVSLALALILVAAVAVTIIARRRDSHEDPSPRETYVYDDGGHLVSATRASSAGSEVPNSNET